MGTVAQGTRRPLGLLGLSGAPPALCALSSPFEIRPRSDLEVGESKAWASLSLKTFPRPHVEVVVGTQHFSSLNKSLLTEPRKAGSRESRWGDFQHLLLES